jgi:hypothetical protein
MTENAARTGSGAVRFGYALVKDFLQQVQVDLHVHFLLARPQRGNRVRPAIPISLDKKPDASILRKCRRHNRHQSGNDENFPYRDRIMKVIPVIRVPQVILAQQCLFP